MFGTKCPSMTSRWIQSAPAASTARTSSPSLAKSEARIDGAMTSGRDANWADMCAFPNHSNLRRGFSGNTRQAEGQSTPLAQEERKLLPRRHQLPRADGTSCQVKCPILLDFRGWHDVC